MFSGCLKPGWGVFRTCFRIYLISHLVFIYTEAGSQKRLRSVQLKNGKTIIYTPEYYVNAPLLIDTVKYNMINTTNGESSVEHTCNIVLSSEDIRSTSQALGFTIKLNNGTVVLLNGNGLFALRYLAD